MNDDYDDIAIFLSMAANVLPNRSATVAFLAKDDD